MASKPPVHRAPRGSIIAACIAMACAVATPFIMQSEGLRTKPYLDPAKIPTVCYGETNIEMRVYSRDECGAMLRQRLNRVYGPKIARCLPQLIAKHRINEFAAMIDSAYNAGPDAVCNSRMARHIRAGDWTAACNSIESWYTTARDRRTGQRIKLRGLVLRRQEMRRLCLRPE